MATTLRLGHFDTGSEPASWREYIARYHESRMRDDAFRGDRNGVWRRPTRVSDGQVARLQGHLKNLGYMPRGDVDGRFGYRTQAAVRLFQAYSRYLGHIDASEAADGIVGPNTRALLTRALASSETCRWTKRRSSKQRSWPELIRAAQPLVDEQYQRTHPALLTDPSDTQPPADWRSARVPVHVLALRRTSWAASLDGAGRRLNNDVFVVSINGRDMYFFGSTDPDPARSTNAGGAPFLVKGQHRYRFGFHRLAQDGVKCYHALRPASNGVRVIRDTDGDRSLSAGDQLDPKPNATINFHWSGRGTSNWSAGCQVIAGAAFLDDDGEPVDCWDHAAIRYDDLGAGRDRGAYELMMSWITVSSPDITTNGTLPLTLLEERDLDTLDSSLRDAARAAFGRAARTVAQRDRGLRNLLAERAPELLA